MYPGEQVSFFYHMKQSVWFVEVLDQVQPQDTLKSVFMSQIGGAVPCWGWWLRISRSTVVLVQASSASLIKRSCIIKNSPSGRVIHEPTDCCLCTSAIVIVPFMCLLYLTLLSLYIVFVSWWLLLFFYFFLGRAKVIVEQSTVILDRVALQENREKANSLPSNSGKEFFVCFAIAWGWNWRKRTFQSSSFTESYCAVCFFFYLIRSYNGQLFSVMQGVKSEWWKFFWLWFSLLAETGRTACSFLYTTSVL